MANEITVTLSINVDNSPFKWTHNPSQLQIDQSAIGLSSVVQNIGTSEETVTINELTSEGIAFFQNLDSTNFVEIGPDNTGIQDFIKLKPGEFAMLRLKPGITVKAQADTAAVELWTAVLED